jgi:ATP-dependent Clp protease adaptor protein ClpS
MNMDAVDDRREVGVIDRFDMEEDKANPPPQWAVLFLNDDTTPVDLVIRILSEVFELPYDEAVTLTYKIHESGQPGVAGVYGREIAVLKSALAEQVAAKDGYPLKTELREA